MRAKAVGVAAPYVHPTAVIDEGAELGDGARVWHFCHVSAGARLGPRASLGQGCFVGRRVRIGAGARIQNHVSIFEGVDIEDDVFLGPSCTFTNVRSPRAFVDRKAEFAPTRVGRGATVGAGAVIVCGNHIGEYAFVGAGAVVTRPVEPYALVVGNPARRVGWVSRVGRRLGEGPIAICPETGERFRIDADACRPEPAAEEAPSPPAAPAARVPLVDLEALHASLRPALERAFQRVAESGSLVLGPEVEAFERAIAARLGVAHAVGVSSGTDALLAALLALGVGSGDEVVVPAYSFVATAAVVERVGATPVFADVSPDSLCLTAASFARALTPRTRAVIPVHLFGRTVEPAVFELARARQVFVIEDGAQALGATSGAPVGTLGHVGCFSFFPSKPLGALGDGGLCTTHDASLAARLRVLRSQGASAKGVHERVGGNFRLDALQAALLGAKLPHLDAWLAARRQHAERYAAEFEARGLGALGLSWRAPRPGEIVSQWVVRVPQRDHVRAALEREGVGTAVYYPLPLPHQPCFSHLRATWGDFPVAEQASRDCLALPTCPMLTPGGLGRVVASLERALRGLS